MDRNDTFEKRKQLRLKNFDYSSNGAYFITVCTRDRRRIFGEIKNTPVGATLCGRPNNPDKMVEKWLLETENKFDGVKIYMYVIMPDHIHFIIVKTGAHAGAPLQNIMNWFKTMTTNEYIQNVKKGLYPPFKKSIWQRGYYEHIIRSENDMSEVCNYIKTNPQKWANENK